MNSHLNIQPEKMSSSTDLTSSLSAVELSLAGRTVPISRSVLNTSDVVQRSDQRRQSERTKKRKTLDDHGREDERGREEKPRTKKIKLSVSSHSRTVTTHPLSPITPTKDSKREQEVEREDFALARVDFDAADVAATLATSFRRRSGLDVLADAAAFFKLIESDETETETATSIKANNGIMNEQQGDDSRVKPTVSIEPENNNMDEQQKVGQDARPVPSSFPTTSPAPPSTRAELRRSVLLTWPADLLLPPFIMQDNNSIRERRETEKERNVLRTAAGEQPTKHKGIFDRGGRPWWRHPNSSEERSKWIEAVWRIKAENPEENKAEVKQEDQKEVKGRAKKRMKRK